MREVKFRNMSDDGLFREAGDQLLPIRGAKIRSRSTNPPRQRVGHFDDRDDRHKPDHRRQKRLLLRYLYFVQFGKPKAKPLSNAINYQHLQVPEQQE